MTASYAAASSRDVAPGMTRPPARRLVHDSSFAASVPRRTGVTGGRRGRRRHIVEAAAGEVGDEPS